MKYDWEYTDTVGGNACAAVESVLAAGVWRRRASKVREVAPLASREARDVFLDTARRHDMTGAAEQGRAGGRLFRALELAYDMGLAHGRKVSP